MTRVADIFGHAISKLLNASNLATLAAKVDESVTEFKADCDSLPDRLQLVLKNLGVSEADSRKCGPGADGEGGQVAAGGTATARSRRPWSEPSPMPSSRPTARRWDAA